MDSNQQTFMPSGSIVISSRLAQHVALGYMHGKQPGAWLWQQTPSLPILQAQD